MSLETPKPADRPSLPDLAKPATKGDILLVAAAQKLVTIISGGFSSLAILFAVAIPILGGFYLTVDRAEAKGAEAGAAKAEQVAKDLEQLKLEEARHYAAEFADKQALRTEVHEMRGELRESYKFVRWGLPSAVLEKPLPPLDGGLR